MVKDPRLIKIEGLLQTLKPEIGKLASSYVDQIAFTKSQLDSCHLDRFLNGVKFIGELEQMMLGVLGPDSKSDVLGALIKTSSDYLSDQLKSCPCSKKP